MGSILTVFPLATESAGSHVDSTALVLMTLGRLGRTQSLPQYPHLLFCLHECGCPAHHWTREPGITKPVLRLGAESRLAIDDTRKGTVYMPAGLVGTRLCPSHKVIKL